MNQDSGTPQPRLTKREREVLTQFLDHDTSQAVADQLFVSKRTVDFHLANAYAKLRTRSRIGALIRAGYLTVAQPADETLANGQPSGL